MKAKSAFELILRYLIFLGVVIPFIVLILIVIGYGVDVPFWDQWNFVPLLGKSYEQGVTFNDLWGQHNEHRLLVPRVIMLFLAHITDYNIIYELGLNIILGVSIFGVIFFLIYRISVKTNDRFVFFSLPLISLFSFSLNQMDNWMWGWQIQIFLNVLASSAGIVILSAGSFRWRKLFICFFLGLIATYSFALGLIYWIVCFFLLIFLRYKDLKHRSVALSVWMAASIFVCISYFYKFKLTDTNMSFSDLIGRPLNIIEYVLKYIGAPIINYPLSALLMGIIGAFIFIWILFKAFGKRNGNREILLPILGLSLYAILSGVMTSIGRVSLGTSQGMSYRYVTISSLFWYSIIIFLFSQVKKFKGGTAKLSSILFIVLISALLIRVSYRVGYSEIKKRYYNLSEARMELLKLEDEKILQRLYINTDSIKYGASILRKHRLSVFRK